MIKRTAARKEGNVLSESSLLDQKQFLFVLCNAFAVVQMVAASNPMMLMMMGQDPEEIDTQLAMLKKHKVLECVWYIVRVKQNKKKKKKEVCMMIFVFALCVFLAEIFSVWLGAKAASYAFVLACARLRQIFIS